MLYPLNSSWIYIKSPTFQKTIRVIAEQNSIWHSVIYKSKHFSPPNANKYILKHLLHTFQLLIYHKFTLYPSKSSLFQIHHYISENYQTSRGTKFNLTHCDLPIKRHLASKRNKYILKHLQHTFQLLIYHTLVLYPLNSSWIYIKSPTFQKTIRVIAEHNSIWHCDLLIKRLLASIRNQIYSEDSSTHFSAINLSNLCALPIKYLRDHYWITDI